MSSLYSPRPETALVPYAPPSPYPSSLHELQDMAVVRRCPKGRDIVSACSCRVEGYHLPEPLPAHSNHPISLRLDRRSRRKLFNVEMHAKDTLIIGTWSYGSIFLGLSKSATPYTSCPVDSSRRHAMKSTVSTQSERSRALCSPDSLTASCYIDGASSVIDRHGSRLLINQRLSLEFVSKF
jgi:hypothetical protein